MIQIEESNPSFESCSDCIHSDDSEEMCILRGCIHAVAQLKECYVPKHPTIEPRKKGKWIPQNLNKYDGMISTAVYYYPKCSVCGASANYTNFCPNCGADMREPEDIPIEYFESGGR